jgi:ATP-binding cassette subfamily B protein
MSMWSQLDVLIGDKRSLVASITLASIVSGFAEVGILAIVAQVAAALAGGARTVHANLGPVHLHSTVGTLLLVGLGLAVVRLLLQWPLATLPARIAAEVQSDLRKRLVRAFTQASWDAQSRDREGRLQEIMTTQAYQAAVGAQLSSALLIAAIAFVIMMGSAVLLSPVAAAAVFAVAVIMFILLRPLRVIGVRRSRELSQAQVEYAGGIAETNRLAEESQVFGVTGAQYDRLAHLVEVTRDRFRRAQVLSKLTPTLYQSLIYFFLILALLWLNSTHVVHAASLGAVVLLLLRGAQNGQVIQANYQSLQQSLPFVERLHEAQRRYTESKPVDGPLPLSLVQTLGFEDVSFSYSPDREVLSQISFAVDAGEAIGIVGPSGAGKSTLVQILLRLRDPASGRYLVNGIAVDEFSREDWHKLVAYVPQEPRLLHASVAENIRFFRDMDDATVERAARLARIHDDIVAWRDGYDTRIGPRADAVSGGQQQRICLARALAARPQVLVLDEPTSALDPHSEALIQESLTALKSELTLFTIAHRMSTLDMCNRVMVIIDGRLVAFDTKAVLQEENPYYRSASLLAAGTGGGMLFDDA